MTILRSKIPELILEAGMVVFAVIVALGVDEWRESRSNAELARRAMAGVVAEIESNRDELASARERNQALLSSVREAAEDSVLPENFNVNYEYSLISSSAWETAQVTRSTQYMPLEQVQHLARLYGLQELFQRSQDQVMELILTLGEVADREPDRIPRLLRGPLTNAIGMEGLLFQAYDSTLANIRSASR